MSKFRILWIDDQPRKCKREKAKVEKIVQSFGFEPDIDLESDISSDSLKSPNGTLYKKMHARNVDLFLIDYNLKNNVLGSNIVQEIRKENDIYSDIVFYSSLNTGFIEAIKTSFDASNSMEFFDGVYIVPLGDEFSEKVQYVIHKIIKSWYNVHSIRGIVLSKASKFEHLLGELIREYYQPCLQEIKSVLSEKGKNVCKTTSDKWKNVEKHEDPIPRILEDPINFNWAVKKCILREMLNRGVITISTFQDIVELFKLRNDFAHNPIHLENGKLVLQKVEHRQYFTESDIEDIRKMLMRIEHELEQFQFPSKEHEKDYVTA